MLSKKQINELVIGKSERVLRDIISYHTKKAATNQRIVALAKRELKKRGSRNEILDSIPDSSNIIDSSNS